jgi:hypothetical protein
MDVGGQSEQPDEGDRRKAAFSDALKRAAVKFGIGRYLYRLPQIWCDYDPKKRQFVRPPTLPASALPKVPDRAQSARAAPAASLPAASAAAPERAKKASTAGTPPALPANGAELQRRLYDYDARLARQGVCKPGDLVKHIVQAGVKAGYETDLATWSEPAIAFAVEQTRAFETRARQEAAERKDVA